MSSGSKQLHASYEKAKQLEEESPGCAGSSAMAAPALDPGCVGAAPEPRGIVSVTLPASRPPICVEPSLGSL
jgi:hypothetical protein